MQNFQELNILVRYVQMVRFGFIYWNEELLVLAMEEIEMNSDSEAALSSRHAVNVSVHSFVHQSTNSTLFLDQA